REKHRQEVANLRFELDKLRSVRVELSMRKEDATKLGQDQLRLTLESVQEKYANLKSASDKEVKSLQAKLVWYIENQPLIDQLQAELAASKTECQALRDENLTMTHLLPPGARSEASGKEIKVKPRPADVKRIKELEARVAELSDMLRKKSAPAGTA